MTSSSPDRPGRQVLLFFSLLQKAEQRGQSHAAASGWAQGTHSEHAFIPEPRAALADGYAILDLEHSNWNFVWMESRNCQLMKEFFFKKKNCRTLPKTPPLYKAYPAYEQTIILFRLFIDQSIRFSDPGLTCLIFPSFMKGRMFSLQQRFCRRRLVHWNFNVCSSYKHAFNKAVNCIQLQMKIIDPFQAIRVAFFLLNFTCTLLFIFRESTEVRADEFQLVSINATNGSDVSVAGFYQNHPPS